MIDPTVRQAMRMSSDTVDLAVCVTARRLGRRSLDCAPLRGGPRGPGRRSGRVRGGPPERRRTRGSTLPSPGRAPATTAGPPLGHSPSPAPRNARTGVWKHAVGAGGPPPHWPRRRPPPPRSPSPGRHRALCAIRWYRARRPPRPRNRTFEQPESVGGRRRCSARDGQATHGSVRRARKVRLMLST